MDEMTLMFLEESRDNIERFSENILILEKEPENIDVINELFRAAHTLKGMYATMGFDSFAELTHKMEDLMDKFRNKQEKVTSDRIDVLLKCVSIIDEMTVEYEKTGSFELDIQEYIDLLNLSSIKSDNNSKKSNENKYYFENYDKRVIEIQIHIGNIEMKSVRLLMFLNNIENYLEVAEAIPSKDDIISYSDENELDEICILRVIDEGKNENELKKIISMVGENSDKNLITDVNITIFTEDKDAVESNKEVNINTVKKEEKKKTVKKKTVVDNLGKTNQIVRIESEKLDNMMNLIAEMVTEKNRLELRGKQLQDDILTDAIDRIDRIITNIQDIIMKVRMVEMENTFKIFPREIRNICKKLEKKIDLTIEGGDTELDRTVVDQIKNPLVHIIKNSLDHGIEKPEERIKKGKNPEGKLLIKAHYEGNQVVITVSDDGKGMNAENIAEKAIQKGLVSEEKVNGMSKQEKINLICVAGFSTSEEVTELSGRGVGLDAVKSFVQGLNGSVEIESIEDEGTTIKLYVPLTLAIIQSMLIGVNEEIFAVPLHAIESIVDASEVEFKKANNKEVIVYKKKTIPVIHLSDIVKSDRFEEEEKFVVLVKKAGKLYGLMVHEVIGQQEIVIKNLGEHLKTVKEYSGATILGDGSVALILDIMNAIS